MPIRTVASFVAYQPDGAGEGVPLIARGAPGSIFLAAPDSTLTATLVQAYRLVDGALTNPSPNVHGIVDAFRVEASEDCPGVWFVSGRVSVYRRFEEGRRGDQGLPGTNGVPTDTAVGTYVGSPGTQTRTAIAALLASELVKLPTARIDAAAEGVTGNGTTDDFARMQACIDKAQLEGKELYVGAGMNVRITEPLRMKRDTLRMVLDPSARIFATNETRLFANGAQGQTVRGFDNVYIEGGTWDLSGAPGWGSAFTIGRMKNLTIRNVTIKGISNSHGFELAGVDGFLLENITGAGFKDTTVDQSRGYAELIQLERINTAGFNGFAIEDNYPTKNGVIRRVRQADPPSGFSRWPVMIGSHAVSTLAYEPLDNITIEDCDLGACTFFSVRATTWTNTVINRVRCDTGTGEGGILLQGQATEQGRYDWRVTNCTITGPGNGITVLSGVGATLTGNTINVGGRCILLTGATSEVKIDTNNGTGTALVAVSGRPTGGTATVSNVDLGGANTFRPASGSTGYVLIVNGTLSGFRANGVRAEVTQHAYRIQGGVATGVELKNTTTVSVSTGVSHLLSSVPTTTAKCVLVGNTMNTNLQLTDVPSANFYAASNAAIL